MSSGISYFVSYACPNCRRQLEARSTGYNGWLRCPICKWPALPPEIMVERRETRRRTVQQGVNNAILVIPASLEGAQEPDALETNTVGPPSHTTPARLIFTTLGADPPSRADEGSHTTPARLIFTTGFALSLFLVLVAYLDDRMGRMAVFAFLSVGFFWLLARSPRNRAAS
jgi:hypothetical protein